MGLTAFSEPRGAVGRGTAELQAGRSWIRFPMESKTKTKLPSVMCVSV